MLVQLDRMKKEYDGFRWIGSHNRYSDGVEMHRYERINK